MVDDRRQVALAAAIGDLINTDREQPVQAGLVEVIANDPLDDLPDGISPDRQQPLNGVLAICCASHATTSSRSRVCAAPSRAHDTGSRRTPHAAQRSRRSSHSITRRSAPRSRWRQRLTRAVMDLQLPAAPPTP
jgi:hypothetical protein